MLLTLGDISQYLVLNSAVKVLTTLGAIALPSPMAETEERELGSSADALAVKIQGTE
jgi:Tfp pilus assembly protein FimT